MKTTKTQRRRPRLNLVIPTDLLRWMKKFAESKNRTVTSYVVEHFTDLKEKHGG